MPEKQNLKQWYKASINSCYSFSLKRKKMLWNCLWKRTLNTHLEWLTASDKLAKYWAYKIWKSFRHQESQSKWLIREHITILSTFIERNTVSEENTATYWNTQWKKWRVRNLIPVKLTFRYKRPWHSSHQEDLVWSCPIIDRIKKPQTKYPQKDTDIRMACKDYICKDSMKVVWNREWSWCGH